MLHHVMSVKLHKIMRVIVKELKSFQLNYFPNSYRIFLASGTSYLAIRVQFTSDWNTLQIGWLQNMLVPF